MDFPLDGTVIAADGGANFLLNRNIIPDVLIGDFDSISERSLEELRTKSEVVQFPRKRIRPTANSRWIIAQINIMIPWQ